MTFTPRIIVALVAIALVALLLIFGPQACQRMRSLAVQNRVNQGQNEATVNSARDAIGTQGDVATNAAASEETTAKNREEIRNAQGADQGINPAVRDAGFTSLCRRPSFRNSPSGRVRCPAAPGVANRR